jgi:hypothetical protein
VRVRELIERLEQLEDPFLLITIERGDGLEDVREVITATGEPKPGDLSQDRKIVVLR